MPSDLPSIKLLRKLVRYEPNTGKLFWSKRTPDMFKPKGKKSAEGCCANWNSRYAGKEAFIFQGPNGHLYGRFFKKGIFAHRVAWAIYYGEWPKNYIDHINGIAFDNRIDNLRDVTHQENMKNAKIPKTNKSGVCGVCWDKSKSLWVVQVKGKNKNTFKGRFNCIAYAACVAAIAYSKENYHSNHGLRRLEQMYAR